MSNSVAAVINDILSKGNMKEKYAAYMKWKETATPEEIAAYRAENDLHTKTEQAQFYLNAHGYTFKPNCPQCHGQGLLQIGYGKIMYCDEPGCMKESRDAYLQGEKNYVQGGMAYHMTFDVFRTRAGTRLAEIKEAAMDWANAQFQNLLIIGGTGNGKTHLASAAAHALTDQHEDVKYIRVKNLFGELKATFGSDDNATQKLLDYYKGVQFLVLDELMFNNAGLWELDTIEDIVGCRHDDFKSTMITSNLDAQELKDRSPRIESRFRDTERSRAFVNTAPDYRKAKKQ